MHTPDNHPLLGGDLKYLTHLTVILGVVILTVFARFQVGRLERQRDGKRHYLDNAAEPQQSDEQCAATYDSPQSVTPDSSQSPRLTAAQ
jgi:hypothetical protein